MLRAEKRVRLGDPVVSAGDRVYSICTQNGHFADSRSGHVPGEMAGVWAHPIKLLDGLWLAVGGASPHWLVEAEACIVHPTHLEFRYHAGPLSVVRRDLAPDGIEGIVFTWEMRADGPVDWPLRARLHIRSHLQPAWLGERLGQKGGANTVRLPGPGGPLVFRDDRNPWAVAVLATPGATSCGSGGPPPAGLEDAGDAADAVCAVDLVDDGTGCSTLTVFVAGSQVSEAAALETLARLVRDHEMLSAAKRTAHAAIEETCRPILPEAVLERAFQWCKTNCRMLAREVPGIGVGVGAGYPEYPWWFGIDTTYAVPTMAQAGLFELCASSLRLLHAASLRVNAAEPGRVIHEQVTNGVVPNPGNVVETPDFVRAVYRYWLWSGDSALVKEMYPFCRQGLLDYTLGSCDPDGDLCASGRSIIETLEMHGGIECLDVACYTWDALGALAELGRIAGDTASRARVESAAAALAARIRREWWIEEEGLFADARASIREVRALLARLGGLADEHAGNEDLARQVLAAHRMFEPLLDRRAGSPDGEDLHWPLRHWVVLCPLEVGLATREQAERSFQRLESPEFMEEWGMVLHPERRDVMSVNTGLLAMAEARYGRLDQSLRLSRKVASALDVRMPGAISEALPDRWCFLQLWSALGVISPVVEGVFGAAPCAAERRLRVVSCLPAGWDDAELRSVRIGQERFDIRLARRDGLFESEVSGSGDFDLELGWVIPEGRAVTGVELNGRSVEWRSQPSLRGREVVCNAHAPAHLRILHKAASG